MKKAVLVVVLKVGTTPVRPTWDQHVCPDQQFEMDHLVENRLLVELQKTRVEDILGQGNGVEPGAAVGSCCNIREQALLSSKLEAL